MLTVLLCVLLTGCGTVDSGSVSSGWESIPEEETPAAEADGDADSTGDEELSEGSTDSTEEAAEADTEEDAGTEEIPEDETPEVETSAADGIDGTMTGTEEAQSLMTDFMTRWNLNSSNYAVAYKNLVTGEVFYYNELKQWDACSTYKFPLNLLYYDMEAAGEITEDTIIPGTDTPLSECHHQSLEFSNNELSEAMVNNLGAYDVMKQNMRKYFTLTDAEIDDSYYHHNYFCARMMMDCSEYLYNHQSEYPDALAYLEAAQPGEYFKTSITDCVIAQKYGLRDGYNHDAGIIFAPTPFVLSVYTYNAGGNELIAQTAKLFYDYTEGQ